MSRYLHRFMFSFVVLISPFLNPEVAIQSSWPNLGGCSETLRNIAVEL
jgi:hypothetical protein